MLIEDAFLEEGYSCFLAGTGNAAIETLEAEGAWFDALITDIRMPGDITGWSVANRARDLFPHIAVLYFTGDRMVEMTANSVAGGRLLNKPAPIEEIISTVKDLLPQNAKT